MKLVDHFQYGLNSPICLTWELTYACNLACVHCLSSSGRRDPRELTTDECKAVVDELQRMQVFYVNIGGGEPTVRPDFWELLDYAISHHVGVKFSTNGIKLDKKRAAQLAATDYVDVQISLDGATAEVNDHVRGPGSYDTAMRALENLAEAGFGQPKISVVMTRQNVGPARRVQGDRRQVRRPAADHPAAPVRPGRGRVGRAAPAAAPAGQLYDWLVARGDGVLTGDSFFHLSAYGEALPGLNLCGAGRVVCLIDPVGDVYACPFAIHEQFLAGNVRSPGGFQEVWQHSDLFLELRRPQTGGACQSCMHYDSCQGGCMAAKFFTGLPLDGPDPECVRGFGEQALAARDGALELPKSGVDHSRSAPRNSRGGPVPVSIGMRRPDKACETSPLAGLAGDASDSRLLSRVP